MASSKQETSAFERLTWRSELVKSSFSKPGSCLRRNAYLAPTCQSLPVGTGDSRIAKSFKSEGKCDLVSILPLLNDELNTSIECAIKCDTALFFESQLATEPRYGWRLVFRLEAGGLARSKSH
jgi:hypothetical protein